MERGNGFRFRQSVNSRGLPSMAFDNDSDDDFASGINLACAAADMVRMMGTERNSPHPKRRKSRGPNKIVVQMKIYYLPDASPIPKRFQPTDPTVAVHMSQGYGMLILFFTCFTCFQQ